MKSKNWKKELIHTLVILLSIFSFRYSFAEPYVVPTGSMEPTIMTGDRILVNKAAYFLKVPFSDVILKKVSAPKKGDIIVFRYPKDPSINFVKRLMGVPGDKITVKKGLVSVNGKSLKISISESQLETILRDGGKYIEYNGNKKYEIKRLAGTKPEIKKAFFVPRGYYFFMGDNRDNSNDSRNWGLVPESFLKGKAIGVWMSFDAKSKYFPKISSKRIGLSLRG